MITFSNLVAAIFNQTGLEIGSPDWWCALQQQSAPLVEYVRDDTCRVTFLWRDPQGHESHSATVTVLMDINSVTDHHSPQPTQMTRLQGTDIWYWHTELPSRWRGSYQFIPLRSEQLPPWGNDIPDPEQQREWWLTVVSQGVPDRLNPEQTHASSWGTQLSALHLRDAPDQHVWRNHPSEAERVDRGPSIRTWHSQQLQNSRQIWIYESGNAHSYSAHEKSDRPVIILLDGRCWHQNMPVYSAIEAQTQQGLLPPAVYVLIDEINSYQRSIELPCHAPFWQAFMTELLPVLRIEFCFTESPEKSVICGQSFGGLAAMYAAYHWPERFGCVLSQSGSFWWPDVALILGVKDRIHGRISGLRGSLIDEIESYPIQSSLHVYLEVGTREGEMYNLSESLYQMLENTGHRVHFSSYEGGHDRICWRGGLLDGLHWLLQKIYT